MRPAETIISRFVFARGARSGLGDAHAATSPKCSRSNIVSVPGRRRRGQEGDPHMIRQRSGVIVNNCSVAGQRGMGRLSHYARRNGASWASPSRGPSSLLPNGVRVVAVCPTGVDTPMNEGLAALEGTTPSEIAERSAGNLLPVPWIEPEDVAQAVLFLASDGARYVTGSAFAVDAGLLTR
jgi:NAD(P)-dependent dehydrogenase (short-subunit alcohol dehydrogenase family)